MYDFDEVVDRSKSNSMKWTSASKFLTPDQRAADPLPMWVADMDFRVAPAIREALHRQIEMGVLGYGGTPHSYIEAVVEWQRRRCGWAPLDCSLIHLPGINQAFNVAIHAFTEPGDHVVIQTPVYVHFHQDVLVNGRRLITVPLTYENGNYRFDPERFEASLLPNTKLFILCNPHNPTGNIWTAEELTCMAEICRKRGILVLSDEVHQDFIFGTAQRFTSFGSLSPQYAERAIIATGPSKTFNIAGLQAANIFIADPLLRQSFRAQAERFGFGMNNIMGTLACEVGYRHCEDWVDAMLAYVEGNQRYFAMRVKELGLPLTVTPTDSLYLAWVNFEQLGLDPIALNDFLIKKARVWLDSGTRFSTGGDSFMRVNLACPRSLVDEALNRLASAIPGQQR